LPEYYLYSLSLISEAQGFNAFGLRVIITICDGPPTFSQLKTAAMRVPRAVSSRQRAQKSGQPYGYPPTQVLAPRTGLAPMPILQSGRSFQLTAI